jgi:adenylate kinase
MEQKTVVLIGPSGCGKGTQAELLEHFFHTNDPDRPVRRMQTGEKFREFMHGEGYTQKKVKQILDDGALPPGFFPIWIWASLFIEQMTGDEHIITDGFPRRAEESPILHSALEFYERKNPVVISFELSDKDIMERLVYGRKRVDDTPENVALRLRWFRRDVALAIKFFEEHPYYRVVHLDGSKSVEAVHADILTTLEQ